MSLFPELNVFRTRLGTLFDDFERDAIRSTGGMPYVPHHHHIPLDVDYLPMLQPPVQDDDEEGESETEMKRGENQRAKGAATGGSSTAMTTQPSASALMRQPFNVGAVGIRLDVHEDKNSMNIIAELPHGVKKNDVNINVRGSVLSITCDKKAERKEEDKDKKYLLQEISYGTATRTIRLPQYVDINKLTAKFNDADGKLNITVPKKEESKNNEKKIDIQ